MTAVIHGGVTEGELAAASARGQALVDLSASLNPYGPHPRVIEAARGAILHRYPEAEAATLRAAYARAHGLEPGEVLAGNGSTELLFLAIRTLGAPGGRVLIVEPTFGEYRAAAGAAGMEVVAVRAESPAFAPPVAATLAALRTLAPSLVVVCNPNNPTGQLWTRAEIETLRAETTRLGGTLIVDEAYMEFAWPRDESVLPAERLVVVRSFTKMHAIPGLRLGFLAGRPEVVERIAAQQPSWAVSAPATSAGLQALSEREFERESRERVAATRDRLASALRAAGFQPLESQANFILVPAGDPAGFRARMFERGWVLRDCRSFGLPGHVRVAIPCDDQVSRLVAAMEESRG